MHRSALILAGLALLAGCGDPLTNVERLDDVPLAPGTATVAITPAPDESANAPGFLGQLFGGSSAAPPTPDMATATVAPGAVLPFGEIGAACGLPAAALGQVVGQAGGFTLYDSAPGSTALRSHFITGLDDGCPRQFSAALALFGDLATHEAIRYLPGAQRPYSATDTAYEQIKAAFCGVASGTPCGNRIDRLARQMAYVTVYQTFGTNPDWSEILFNDGGLVAHSFQDG